MIKAVRTDQGIGWQEVEEKGGKFSSKRALSLTSNQCNRTHSFGRDCGDV